jgi:hypothetical protein
MTIIIYVIVMIVTIIIKPNYLYDNDNDGSMKQFGNKEVDTYISLPEYGVIISVLTYLFVLIYVFVLAKIQ